LLDFRVIIEADNRLRLIHAKTGFVYPRPQEAYDESMARHRAEARNRELEAQIERLKRMLPPEQLN
jgi:hypothetical protein